MREMAVVSSKTVNIRDVDISDILSGSNIPSRTPRNAQKKITNAQTLSIPSADSVTAFVSALAGLDARLQGVCDSHVRFFFVPFPITAPMIIDEVSDSA